MCRTFWERGACPYGRRCCFVHTLDNTQGLPLSPVVKKDKVQTNSQKRHTKAFSIAHSALANESQLFEIKTSLPSTWYGAKSAQILRDKSDFFEQQAYPKNDSQFDYDDHYDKYAPKSALPYASPYAAFFPNIDETPEYDSFADDENQLAFENNNENNTVTEADDDYNQQEIDLLPNLNPYTVSFKDQREPLSNSDRFNNHVEDPANKLIRKLKHFRTQSADAFGFNNFNYNGLNNQPFGNTPKLGTVSSSPFNDETTLNVMLGSPRPFAQNLFPPTSPRPLDQNGTIGSPRPFDQNGSIGSPRPFEPQTTVFNKSPPKHSVFQKSPQFQHSLLSDSISLRPLQIDTKRTLTNLHSRHKSQNVSLSARIPGHGHSHSVNSAGIFGPMSAMDGGGGFYSPFNQNDIAGLGLGFSNLDLNDENRSEDLNVQFSKMKTPISPISRAAHSPEKESLVRDSFISPPHSPKVVIASSQREINELGT